MVKVTCDFDGVFAEHPLPIETRFAGDSHFKIQDRLSFRRQKPKKITIDTLEDIEADKIVIVTGRPDYEVPKLTKWFVINKIEVEEIIGFPGTPNSNKDVRLNKLEVIRKIAPECSLEDDRIVLESLPLEIGKILIINDSMEIL